MFVSKSYMLSYFYELWLYFILGGLIMTSKKLLIKFSYRDSLAQKGIRTIRIGCENLSNTSAVTREILEVLEKQKISYRCSYVRESAQYIAEIAMPDTIDLSFLKNIADF